MFQLLMKEVIDFLGFYVLPRVLYFIIYENKTKNINEINNINYQ